MTGPERIKAYLDATRDDQRFILTLGAGIVNSILLLFGKLDMGTYAMLIGGTVGAFIAGVAFERKPSAE